MGGKLHAGGYGKIKGVGALTLSLERGFALFGIAACKDSVAFLRQLESGDFAHTRVAAGDKDGALHRLFGIVGEAFDDFAANVASHQDSKPHRHLKPNTGRRGQGVIAERHYERCDVRSTAERK